MLAAPTIRTYQELIGHPVSHTWIPPSKRNHHGYNGVIEKLIPPPDWLTTFTTQNIPDNTHAPPQLKIQVYYPADPDDPAEANKHDAESIFDILDTQTPIQASSERVKSLRYAVNNHKMDKRYEIQQSPKNTTTANWPGRFISRIRWDPSARQLRTSLGLITTSHSPRTTPRAKLGPNRPTPDSTTFSVIYSDGSREAHNWHDVTLRLRPETTARPKLHPAGISDYIKTVLAPTHNPAPAAPTTHIRPLRQAPPPCIGSLLSQRVLIPPRPPPLILTPQKNQLLQTLRVNWHHQVLAARGPAPSARINHRSRWTFHPATSTNACSLTLASTLRLLTCEEVSEIPSAARLAHEPNPFQPYHSLSPAARRNRVLARFRPRRGAQAAPQHPPKSPQPPQPSPNPHNAPPSPPEPPPATPPTHPGLPPLTPPPPSPPTPPPVPPPPALHWNQARNPPTPVSHPPPPNPPPPPPAPD
jgi:hypothetical protein